jgi:hypothetical protein
VGLGDAEGFRFVGGVAKACGINEFYWNAFDGDALCDGIAGGAGGGGDDGAIALDEAVEEGGFAGVGAAYDGEGEAVADDAAVGEGLFECEEGGLNRLYLRGDFVVGEEVNVVFGEVDSGFEGGDEGD